MQSRYYNPEWGRFINADALVSTGQGLLGNNMFAYCGNNPVCKVDITGTKPYEIFDTADEAAIDFAECYNAKSIAAKKEYGSAIYRIKYYTFEYVSYKLVINFLGLKLEYSYSIPMWTLKTGYYYTSPFVGDCDGVFPNILGFGTLVATIHTHANYNPAYKEGNDNFSSGRFSDLYWACFFGKDMYVATPSGYLKKFTYRFRHFANGGIHTISDDIPWDPNSPHR